MFGRPMVQRDPIRVRWGFILLIIAAMIAGYLLAGMPAYNYQVP